MLDEMKDPSTTTGNDEPNFWLGLAKGRSDPRIPDVVALGDEARATLGLLPAAIYHDYADERGLLLAVDANGVVGYAMFDLTVRHVRLVHLCVAKSARHKGIAREMVSWISREHRERPGILAWCRLDYGLGPVWSALGFD